jgi:GNAT superfamily N-acetyltransferase
MSEKCATEPIHITGYADKYVEAFARLNREWLESYSLLEDGDLKHLEYPRQSILATGGEIFFALIDGAVVGTCAVIVRDAETVELAKLAVDGSVRGRGIGWQLTQTAIEWARRRGARRVTLASSTKLRSALRLYERLGFEYGPPPSDPEYTTADVYMELVL